MSDKAVEKDLEMIVGDTKLPLTTNKKGQFVVSKKDYLKYLDKEGVTDEVLKTVAAAEEKLLDSSYRFLAAEVIATKEDQSMKIGSGDRTLFPTVHGEKTILNPQTKKQSKTYGSCSLRERRVIPAVLKNSDMMQQIEADIAAAYK